MLRTRLGRISRSGNFSAGASRLYPWLKWHGLPLGTIKGFHVAKSGSWAWLRLFDGRASNLVRIYEAPVRFL